MTPADAVRVLDDLARIAARAAEIILARPAAPATRLKPDASPVTEADVASEAAIVEDLSSLLPGVPLIAEESAAGAAAVSGSSFVLIDPLDGTKEFIAGRNEYTVNIAIVSRGAPVASVIAAPARGVIWRAGDGVAERAPLTDLRKWTRIRTRACPAQGAVAAVSRSHPDAESETYLARFPLVTRTIIGSALKFCLIAQGEADIYPRLAPTSEWDVAAGHALVIAAGGEVTAPDGSPLVYGKPGFCMPGFVAFGDPEKAR